MIVAKHSIMKESCLSPPFSQPDFVERETDKVLPSPYYNIVK
jgi:hypothetical protein